ncbi:O-antigen polysaccharide polymerase Wzy family protein [Paraclostridium ghonii]|uniref:O-antigen polysaccharide polymerase Wzy family protein n=1 Tax=Paraclostridium ghonii TaxID=29358 RepID=UPI0035243BA1
MIKNIRYSVLFFSISIFLIGIFFANTNVILVGICTMIIHNFIYSFENFNDRIIFFAFNGTFFTFLIGRLIVKTLTSYTDIYNNNKYGLDFYDDKVIMHIFITLFISLLFIFIGYTLAKNKKSKSRKNNILSKYNQNDIESIRLISKILFYITYIFSSLVLLDKARFSNNVGYMELYASYSSSFPFWVTKLAEMNTISLFVFLGTLPAKRKSFIPILLYSILGILSLVIGQRNNFVLNIMIIIVYLFLRNNTDKKERWFGKKELITCIVIFPILIVILNSVSYIRFDKDVNKSSLGSSINEFFYSQGASVNLIGYAETMKNEIGDNRNYTFGRIITFIKNNSITQALMDIPMYESQTVESALYGNSFADSVSYRISPNRYINGWGYGSSYVAELYIDYGYIGVAIGNMVIGFILGYMGILFTLGPLNAAISLFMTRLLLYAPRDTTMSFIVTTFNLINTLTIFLIFIGWKVLISKKRRNINCSED